MKLSNLKLHFILEWQPEGGFTITCQEIPEMITECDGLDDIGDNVIDALKTCIKLYEEMPCSEADIRELEIRELIEYLEYRSEERHKNE